MIRINSKCRLGTIARATCVLVALMTTLSARSDAVPALVNYQGYLSDFSSTAVTGVFPMTFRLFPDSTAGTASWTESYASVSVVAGVFNVVLGSVTPLPPTTFTGSKLWLQTTVNGADVLPRRPIITTPYAFRAAIADSAITTGGDSLWYRSGPNVYRPGGLVGIGTVPQSVLDIVIATGSHDTNAIRYTTVNPSLRLNSTAQFNHQSLIRFDKVGIARWSLFNDVNGDDSQNFGLKNWLTGTVPLFIDGNGSVGIGTTSPAAFFKLDVAGTGRFVYYAEVSDDGSRGPQLGLVNRMPQGRSYSASSGEIAGRPSQFNIVDETAGGLPRLSIDESGNVGIDNATPHAKLDVTGGDIAVSSPGNGLILHATNGGNCYRITVNNAGTLTATLVPCP